MAHVRPPSAATGAPLARASVLGALFGQDSTAGLFGRFRVHQRLGAGGMGVVYEAYDPDLARGVALKLVSLAGKDRDAALAEAQALAKLSHPHVVPIYDVGIERDHVYLVMELVRGQTLRAWVQGQRPRAILGVYHQAGLALAAAHAIGLVHRDFKPDNAIVGADGRVRVVDFGLACQADLPGGGLTEPRPAAGTPRFMAPEIAAGGAVTPAADQYSFCVSLGEAMQGAREAMPRRIAAILERGRATDPAARFPSMAELLRALERDPARAWRRVVAASGAAVIVGTAAFLFGRQQHAGAADPCTGGAARLEAAWPGAARSAALDRVAALGDDGAALRALLDRGLATHARSWDVAYGAACQARHLGTETEAMSDRRTVCLERGIAALTTVRDIISHAGPGNLAELPRAVQSIPDPELCSDLDALASDIAQPPAALAGPIRGLRDRITQADVEVGAGRYEQALAIVRPVVAAARSLGYPPLLAEALLVDGHAQMNLPGRKAAVPILVEATRVALSSRADPLAVEAWARRTYAQATSQGTDGAMAGLDVIEPLAQRTASASFARALLYNNLGSVAIGRGDPDQARAYFARGVAESRAATGRGALELVVTRANLALVTADRAVADQLFSEAIAELTERLGLDHPDTLVIRQQRALVTVADLRRSEQLLAAICRADERYPALANRVAECWTELALVRRDLGQHPAAIEAMQHAAEAGEPTPEAGAYVALWRGDAQLAARQFTAALAGVPAKPDEPWWDRMTRAQLMLGRGQARRAVVDLRGARDDLEAAIAALAPIVHDHPVASYEHRLGRARLDLALTLAALRVSSAETTAVTGAAMAWARRVGVAPAELEPLADR